jgi:hypothetical protein
LNVRTSYKWYLDAARGAEANLTIQRRIIAGSKAYATLRADLKRGCVLPPIVLAVNLPNANINLGELPLEGTGEYSALMDHLRAIIEAVEPSNVYIIDGLQRTNALRQVLSELDGVDRDKSLDTNLRLEVWINISFGALAYRMLLLNAGQRPMSIKHQVEILSLNLKTDLQSIPKIDIIDAGRRSVHPGQFQLSKLSLSFQAWLQGTPNVDVRNVVVEQMMADSALATLSSSIERVDRHKEGDAFRDFVAWLVKVDVLLGDENLEFFGNETVLQGLAAAIGLTQRDPRLRERADESLDRLYRSISSDGPQILAISVFEEIRKGIDLSKKNVGEATRNLVFNAFREYFYMEGNSSMADCWQIAGARA